MSCLNKWHILEISNLSVSFKQYDRGTRQIDLPVISDLNVSVHEGEIVAVVGASGSGKACWHTPFSEFCREMPA